MSVKTQRKIKVEPDSSKAGSVKRVRRSAPKNTSKSNGDYPLTAYEHLHIGIVEASLDGKYIDANEEFCRILGYTRKELLQLSIRDCTHEDDYALDIKLHEQLVGGQIPFYGLEKRFVQKDGGVIWVELTRSLVRDAKGKPLCTIGAVIDISDRKQVERTLRESAESLRMATEAARMFKWEFDFEKRICTLADNFAHVLGFSAGLLPQNDVESLRKLSPEEDLRAFANVLAEAIKNRSDLHALQGRVVNPEDGQTIWLEVNAKIVYDESGSVQRMFGLAQNITDNKKAQEEIGIISRMPAENPYPVMRLTADGQVLYANPASEPLLETWKRQAHQSIPVELQKAVQEAIDSELKKQIEIEYQGSSFSCTLAPVREAGYVNLYGNDVTERKRAGRALAEYARQQEALYHLSDELHHTNSLEGVYNAALDAILSGLQCDRASILLFDHMSVMRFVAWRGLSDDYRKATEGHSPWTRAEKNPYPICVGDIAASDLSDSLKAAIQEEGIGSLAFIPLLSNGKLIGKFMAYFNVPHDCSDVEIELGLMIARQLAFGIDRIQAENALRVSEAKLQVELADSKQLQIISSQLIQENNINTLYEQLIDAAMSLMRSDMASIQMFHPEKNELQLLSWKGFHPEAAAFWEWVHVNSSSSCAQAMNSGERVVVADVETSDFFVGSRDLDFYRLSGIKAMQSTPLVSRDGRLVGVISTHWREPHQPLERELHLFDMLARQAADLIERGRGEEALRESEERYRKIIETANEGIWYMDLNAVTVYSNEPMARILGCSVEEVLGHKVPEFCFPEDIPLVQEHIAANHQGNYEHFDFRFRRRDGSEVLVLASTSPVFDMAGKITGALGMFVEVTERKRAEQQLRESEERLRVTFDTAVVGFATLTPDARFVEVNDAFCQIVGYTRAELLKMDCAALTHPFYIESTYDHVSQLIKGEIPSFVLEKLYIRKDGAEIWVQNSVSLVRTADGQPLHLIAICQDITQRVQSEERLRASETLYRTIARSIPGGGVYVVDKDFRYLVAEGTVSEAFGFSREMLEGHTITEVLTPDQGAQMIDRLKQNFAGETISYETKHNGRVYWTQQAPLLDAIGQAIIVTVDITERKQAEEALRKSEERYRGIFNQTISGIAETDLTGKFTMVNDHYCEITGYPREKLLNGMRMQDITYPDDLSKNQELFGRLAADGTSFEIEKRYIHPDGSAVWVHNSVSAIISTEGEPQSAVAVVIDITERKQAEDALRIENERFMRFVNSNIVGILIGDANGKVIVANDYYLRLLGVSRQDLIEEKADWKKFTPSEWLPADERAIQELREHGICEPYEKEYVRADGTRVPVYVADAMLPGPKQEIAAFVLDITERKQAEDALRQSEERFVRFMHNLPGLAWIKDGQGQYVFANAAAEKAFNTPREKLYGRTDAEVFPPEVAVQFKQNDELALASEKGVQTVETLGQEDGILHYSLVTKFPIPSPDGRTALIGGTAFDITERLQAEEALRESEARFRALVNQATAGILRQDAEGRLVFVNHAFCNMLGYTEADLLGKTTWEFTHEDDIAENKRLYERMMKEGIPFKLEKRLIRADGSTVWMDVSVDPVTDAAGNPQSAVAVEVDITARKQAEEALQQLNLQLESRVQKRTATIQAINQSLRDEIAERKRIEEALRQSEEAARASEEKLRTLFDLLPVGISFLDPEGKILQINTALLDIVKLSRAQLFSQAYKSRRYIRADSTPMLLSELASARALAENRTIYNVETGIILENGETVWTSVSAAPVDVADVGVVVVTIDITESKRAERALKESHRRLRLLSQRLVEVQEDERRALARELHDRVGQTLAALNINLIIINSQLSPDVAQQIGTRLNDSMKLVAETIALVRDVMTDLRPAVLDDYGLEAALESQLSKFTSRYNIKVVFEKPDRPIPRLGPSVEMTFMRIAQEALMNIARHAQAGQVNLSLRQEEDEICLSIHDDGIGIESWQDANRLGSHGLTIMRERADAFGGRLRVSSAPGQGTTVEVSIPFKSNDQERAQEQRL